MAYFDFGINLAFWLTLLSTLLCVIYGFIYWNKDGFDSTAAATLKEWEDEEELIEKEL